MSLLGLLAAAVFGAAGLRVLVPPRAAGPGGGPVVHVLGAGLGVAVLSAVRYWALLAGLPAGGCRLAEFALLAGAVALARRRTEGEQWEPPAEAGGFRAGRVVLAAFVGLQLLAAALSFRAVGELLPHGMWDAFGFWNARARVLALSGDDWRRAFDGTIPHPDYPLLLPLTVVRGWDWAGESDPGVGFATAAAFSGLTVALLFVLLRALRGTTAGLLAVAVYLSTWAVQLAGPAQYADVPLGFFALGGLGCLALAARSGAGPWLAAAGLCLSAAAWTKNDGLAWAVVGAATVGMGLVAGRLPRRAAAFLAGLLPIGLTVVAFKVGVAGPHDLIAGQSGSGLAAKLIDADRHRLIAEVAYLTAPAWLVWLPVCGLLLGVRRSDRGPTAGLFAPLAGVAALYYLVYLLSPFDLAWHLATSLDRLVVHLWPGFLLAAFVLIRTPEESLAAGAGRAP